MSGKDKPPRDGADQSPAQRTPGRRIGQIAELWRRLEHVSWNDSAFSLLSRQVQGLAAEAGGLDTPARAIARELESLCRSVLDAGTMPNQVQRGRITELIRELAGGPPEGAVPAGGTVPKPAVCLMIESDPLGSQLADLAGQLGYQVRTCPADADPDTALARTERTVLVLDAIPRDRDAAARLAGLKHDHPTLAGILFISSRGDMEARLQAIRAGGDAYLPLPLDLGSLAEKLDDLSAMLPPGPARILVIDDDPVQSSLNKAMLENAGMTVEVVNQPMLIIETLMGFRPDLILLDLYMPECDGFEVARLIRQHGNFAATPIVFLSSEQDRDKQEQALSFGADDFLEKPVDEGSLITTITSRIRRAHMLQGRMRYLSNKDPVTGLYSRQYFYSELRAVVAAAVHGETKGAVLHIEVDNYRVILEQLQTHVESLVIGRIAGLVSSRLAPGDMLARLTGKALGVISRLQTPGEVLELAESICRGVEQHLIETPAHSLTTTCSIGVVLLNENTSNAQQVMYAADVACNAVQSAGGNGVHRFDAASDEEIAQESGDRCAALIRVALKKKDSFRLVYQPIIHLGDDQEERYGVLTRLYDEQDEVVMPSTFFPVAVQQGLVASVDSWIFNRVIDILKRRHAEGHETGIFVKIDGASLGNERLHGWLDERLKAAALPEGALVFELREKAAFQHLREAKAFSAIVQKHGCGLCLEHFGTLASPEQVLNQLPVHYVKIDSSFLRDLGTSQEHQQRIRSIVELAHARNIRTIAALVEDAMCMAVLWQCGVHYTQGDFLEPPREEMDYDFFAQEE